MNKGIWITDAKGSRRPAQRVYDDRGKYLKTMYTDTPGGEFKGFPKAAPPKITKPSTDK